MGYLPQQSEGQCLDPVKVAKVMQSLACQPGNRYTDCSYQEGCLVLYVPPPLT